MATRAAWTPTLLAVDDDPGMRLLAEAAFDKEGYAVLLASSGEEALELLRGQHVDVILLDLLMPGMDGFETCTRIKADPELAQVPIIVLTGLDDVDAVEEAYAAGAWDFTAKPINWPILKHRVRYALRASRAFAGERQAARLSRTIDNSHSEVITYELETGRLLSANRSALKNLGFSEAELVDMPFFSIAHGPSGSNLAAELAQLPDRGQVNASLTLLRRDGTRYPAEGIFLFSGEEQPYVVIGILQDVSERRRVEAELHRLAHYDELTQLPNRRLLNEHVRGALARAARSGSRCAICLLDLDGFKRVNDTLGHSAGDRLLQEVAERLTGVVRAYDVVARDAGEEAPHLSQLARFGGDEFFLLVTDFADETAPSRVASRVLQEVAMPYEIGGANLTITGSLGIALYPDDGRTLDELMMRADTAMYRAKQNGKNNYAYYTPESGANTVARLELETELRAAISEGQLVLHYQPQLDDQLREVVGVEALVRWLHPVHGLRAPGSFIPIAEETGLILPIGDFVLKEALRQLDEWRPLLGDHFKMSVNVSALQLRQDGFQARIRELLQRFQSRNDCLVLEITESALMTHAASRLQWLEELKAVGVQIAIDDFGTGYSSLSYLTRFPIDFLKVDQSFVADLERGSEGAAVTRAVFRMAQELGIRIIAEGVESERQLQLLRAMGRCTVQGWLVSKARPPAELLDFVLDYRRKGPSPDAE
ncbi:EAL domain-containing protein [Pseudohaliea sp.]|uniref:putative bifunctional diguanylate cyclase/phosphodiesterase n=1 Tax=Pseudohaliea sp. TaxID=2740289 RepID=UPI0032EB3D9A